MKISINSETGTRFLSAFTLEGAPAVEGVDFIKWEGTYHKNGKWSYTEGGIGAKNLVFFVLNKCTHTVSNNVVRVTVIENDAVVYESTVGKVREMEEAPTFEKAGRFKAVCIMAFYQMLKEHGWDNNIDRWERNALFF